MPRRKPGRRPNGQNKRQQPARYQRAMQRKQDPAAQLRSMPPNFGHDVAPHVATFQGLQSTVSHAYRPSDEALRHSIDNARFMRNDVTIMECLESRYRGTALLNWHLEPEDPKDDGQQDLCEKLKKILMLTPRFTEMRRWLMEAVWFGRCATQNTFGWDIGPNRRRLYVKDWKPIHGDKLVFRFDDGTGKHDPNQIGIRYSAAFGSGGRLGAAHRKLEPTDYGMAYFLEPWERSLVTLHRHMIEDAPYEDPQSAGRIHGVGVRDRIYWAWYQKQEALAMLIELIERTGQGFNMWYYPDGNPAAKAATEEAAKNQAGQNSILIPRTPGEAGNDAYGFDRIEPTGAGVESLKSVVHELFGHQIKRYILGQTLSTEADATGLGSGVADLHLDSFLQIIKYDATNLEETLTTDLVEPLKRYNFPSAAHIRVHFKIDTEAADTQSKLQAAFTAWQMGAAIKETDIFDLLGMSQPGENDKVLRNPEMQQQPGAPGAGGMPPGMGQEGAEGGDPMQQALDGTPQQPPGGQELMQVMSQAGVQAQGTKQAGDWNVTSFGA